MTVLYPNPCYNDACYKGSMLYFEGGCLRASRFLDHNFQAYVQESYSNISHDYMYFRPRRQIVTTYS